MFGGLINALIGNKTTEELSTEYTEEDWENYHASEPENIYLGGYGWISARRYEEIRTESVKKRLNKRKGGTSVSVNTTVNNTTINNTTVNNVTINNNTMNNLDTISQLKHKRIR